MERNITNRFRTEVAEPNSLTVQYPNIRFDKPEDAPWLTFDILWGVAQLVENAGGTNNRFTQPGIIMVEIFAPIRTGTDFIRSAEDWIMTPFRDTDLRVGAQDYRYLSPYPERPAQPREVDSFYQRNVLCPFEADFFKP
jgi:hypothetical protein